MFDCTMLNNELDLLEIRLHTLNDVVERFVIVESPLTHSGKSKPLHYQNNQHRFKDFWHKIDYLIYPGFLVTENTHAWGNENRQRDYFLEILKTRQPQDGLIFYSDMDEIPRPEKLLEARELLRQNPDVPVAFELTYCLYYMNWAFDAPSRGALLYDPNRAQAFHRRWGVENHAPTALRWHSNAAGSEGDFQTVYNAGWHFSALGGVEKLTEKIQSCAHREFDTPEINNPDHLITAMNQGQAYFKEFTVFNAVDQTCKPLPQESLPPYVLANLEKFQQYLRV